MPTRPHAASGNFGGGRVVTAPIDNWMERDAPPQPGAKGRLAALAGGVAISVIILLALHFAQHIEAVRPAVEARELRAVALPPPPPPPAITSRQQPPPELMEMIPVPTASPVKFVVPLDPVPVPRLTAEARISFAPEAFKPNARALQPAVDRIYHAVEVDRIPVPIYRKTPRVPNEMLRRLDDPRVLLTFVVTVRGQAENITVVQTSNAEYGQLVAEAVAEWRFEPAMKGGRRVRCLVLQSVSVRASSGGGSPFATD